MYNKNIEISGINNGYFYFIDYEHPLSTGNSGRVYLHRHNASLKLGRWLTTDEHVHHLDKNKLNNDSANLEVLSHSEHFRIHFKEQRNLPDDYEWFEEETKPCLWCKNNFVTKYKGHSFCSVSCSACSQPEKFPIDKDILSELIWKMPATEIAKIYGCSDRTIGKKCVKYNITKPPTGYWLRK